MPWVPRDLYDELIATLRASRAPVVVPFAGTPEANMTPVLGTQAGADTPAPIMLSPAVYASCVRYAFGDPNEKAANLRIAKSLMRDGVPDAQILEAIRTGAAPVTL